MVAKSSVKENKDDALKVLPNQEKVHQCGRGEVASVTVEISPDKKLLAVSSFFRSFFSFFWFACVIVMRF
jgi:hypothetical protein